MRNFRVSIAGNRSFLFPYFDVNILRLSQGDDAFMRYVDLVRVYPDILSGSFFPQKDFEWTIPAHDLAVQKCCEDLSIVIRYCSKR